MHVCWEETGDYAFKMHDFKSGKKAKWVLLLKNRNKRSHNTASLRL